MRIRAALAGAAAAMPGLDARAQAGRQSFPSKPATLVVPYPPGGSNDTIARELARRLSDAWRVPVTVENKPGAGGAIGAAAEFRRILLLQGAEPAATTPSQFAHIIAIEIDAWRRVARSAAIKPE